MRAFFALWPDDPTRAALAAAMRQQLSDGDGKLMPMDKLHLTLAFIGAVDEPTLARLDTVAQGLTMTPMRLTLDCCGRFERAAVGWFGMSTIPTALADLVRSLKARLQAAGFEREPRPFRPHVTVLRPCHRMPASWQGPGLEWVAEGFTLVTSEGGSYEVIGTYPSARTAKTTMR
jgi:RNA 2',3'-cyclic 3'-phosphodiesterase